MSILLLELRDIYKSFHDCFVRINAYSLEFQLSRRFSSSLSSPAIVGHSNH